MKQKTRITESDLNRIIKKSVKNILNEAKWIVSNGEEIEGPEYDSIVNPSQNNLPPIDRYHPDYWYYRQEEEPYDPTYDEGYLDEYTVNNDAEFQDDINDWGIEENKQYNKNRQMKRTIKLRETELKRMIAESVKRVLRESNEMPYLSDQDIHKQYEGFEIEDFTIKPRQHRYDGTFGWDVGFEISFPNVDHPDFDDSKWENVDVWDEDGKRMAFDGWYPEDIQQQLITMIRSEIKKHAPEMDAFKNEKNKEEEEHQMEMDRFFNLYKKRKGISNESTNRRIDRIVSECIRKNIR